MSVASARLWPQVSAGLRGFLRWWSRGLLAWLPARWRALLATADDRLLLSPQGDDIQLLLQRQGQVRALAMLPAPLGAGALASLLAGQGRRLPYWLLLDKQLGLRRRLLLPAAAESRLEAVLGFEIERQTPFAAEAVLYAGRILRDHPGGLLEVELVVVPKDRFDAAASALGEPAAQLAGVVLADGDGQPLPAINLLPAARRAQRSSPWRRWNLGLALLAALALMAGFAQLLDNRRAAADALQVQMQAREARARAISDQRQRLLAAQEGGSWLRGQRNGRPSAVEVIDALAQRLPDGTYLEKLAIDGDQLTVIGLSSQAAALVGKLEGAPQWRAPALSGALQQDPRTRQDRFTLTAQLVVADAPAAMPAAEAAR